MNCTKCGAIDESTEAGETTCFECYMNEALPVLEGSEKQIEFAKVLRIREYVKLNIFVEENKDVQRKTRQLLVSKAREKLAAIETETKAGKLIGLLK